MTPGNEADDEPDPLDAFMTEVSKEVKKLKGNMFKVRIFSIFVQYKTFVLSLILILTIETPPYCLISSHCGAFLTITSPNLT